ncbi:MAG: hypothetical protein H0T48_05845 [Gemmatimonadaceae bacterium]|nr:hypothetical protein [Gemmatimonadaceae bacterium]
MPDNAIYSYLAYAIGTGIYVLYAISLVARRNRLRPRGAAPESHRQ